MAKNKAGEITKAFIKLLTKDFGETIKKLGKT